MIVVLDTNVIISALFSPSGPSAMIINSWEADEFDVVVSRPLICELRIVIEYPRIKKYLKIPQEIIMSFLRLYPTVATLVDPQVSMNVVDDDPADNKVLECAVAGKVAYIVTGDKHLLKIKEYQGIVFLPPSGFIKLL